MEFSREEIEEFNTEALDLLDEAERNLLSLERGANFSNTYAAIYRVFHSLKGGAGMLDLKVLAGHMHKLENQYEQCKPLGSIPSAVATYFLKGVDAAKRVIDGERLDFDYGVFSLDSAPASSSSNTQAAPGNDAVPSSPAQKPKGDLSPESVSFYELGARVLIIDDEPELIEIIDDALTQAGFVVAGFTSPAEALKQIKIFKPDVVVTDYKMPEITGLEVLQQVSQLDPDLPVIYVSGHLTKEVILQSLASGVFSAIQKPFNHGALVAVCKNAAERYRLVKLLNNTISFIYYQYSNLDQYLQAQGSGEIREQMRLQVRELIEAKRKLKFLKKSLR